MPRLEVNDPVARRLYGLGVSKREGAPDVGESFGVSEFRIKPLDAV